MEKEVLDFIVIGGEKCGTTSLFEYLRKHPQLCLPSGKQGGYFNNDDKFAQDWPDYLRKQFPDADPARLWGNVTPMYMFGGASSSTRDPSLPPAPADVRTVPARIREQLPDVRLIAILRDPVQRARSHHSMAVLEGWDTRSFDQAIDELLQPEALEATRRDLHEHTGYVVFGEYGRILAGYLEVFPRDQLLVLFTSELAADPHSVLRRIFEFLGVDSDFVPDNLGVRYLAASAGRRIQWLDLYAFQSAVSSNTLARGAWHAIPEKARHRLDAQFNNMNVRTRVWNRRPSAPPTPNASETETDRRLRAHFEVDTALIADLLGVQPPWALSVPPEVVAPSAGGDNVQTPR